MTAISDFEIFARVARTGNMSAAGREMGLSPAVISKRVSMLEERMGARLFQRTTRQLTLTETGEGFFKRVVDILNLIEEAEDFVSRRNDKPRGIIRVSAPAGFARMHIAPHIGRLVEQHAELEFDFQLTDAFTDIIRDGFDLAIRIGELQDSSLIARRLAPIDRVLCATPAYLARFGTPKSLDELEAHQCLTSGPQDGWPLDGPDGRHNIRVRGNVHTNSSDFVRAGVIAGLGIALCATWDVSEELRSGQLTTVLPQYCGSSDVILHALFPSREFMPAKVAVFLDFLDTLYSDDPYWNKGLELEALARRKV